MFITVGGLVVREEGVKCDATGAHEASSAVRRFTETQIWRDMYAPPPV